MISFFFQIQLTVKHSLSNDMQFGTKEPLMSKWISKELSLKGTFFSSNG